MDQVTVNAIQYPVYADDTFGDKYWNGMVGPAADKWAVSSQLLKFKSIIMATELIDNETYVAAANTQALRYAIQDVNARSLFRLACVDLAGQLLLKPSLGDQSVSGSNIERIEAGDGVGVRFFNPTLGETGRFPARVQKLIGAYLDTGSVGGISGSYSTGTKTYGPNGTANVPFDVDGNGYGTTRGS